MRALGPKAAALPVLIAALSLCATSAVVAKQVPVKIRARTLPPPGPSAVTALGLPWRCRLRRLPPANRRRIQQDRASPHISARQQGHRRRRFPSRPKHYGYRQRQSHFPHGSQRRRIFPDGNLGIAGLRLCRANPFQPIPLRGRNRRPAATRTRTERLELVIGSGGKGQNYLFWRGDELFQLPVGYSTVLRHWINSPGYRDGTANFDRPIVPRCLECHAGYFNSTFPGTDSNLYDTKNYVLGITCERCHGPGRRHVETYQQTVDSGRASATSSAKTAGLTIVNPSKLSSARRSDICAQCHGGAGVREILPEFSYVPGQPLSNYIDLGPVDQANEVDVHGKQGKLMMKSRCYQVSKTMECSTCHDVHKKEPDLPRCRSAA